ncbi:MAG TPA: hypothetical protein VGY30_09395 [Solirubrobacteraceae bacterium]|nr:hypothetical protein [Solirubrobacteraceae bacterium]
MAVRIAFAAGLALLALAIAVTLSGSPVVAIANNHTFANGQIAETVSPTGACQAGEVVPAHTSAIRLTLFSDTGPQVKVRVLSGTRVLTQGAVGSGWVGGSVTVPVKPVSRTITGAQTCFKFGQTREKVAMIGVDTAPAIAARSDEGSTLPGRIRVEYMRSEQDSWWSLGREIARRIGIGRVPSGAWVALVAALLMAGGIGVASWTGLRELLR